MGVLSKRSIHNFHTIRCPQFFAFFFWFFFQLWRMRYLLSSVSKSVWCSSHSILVIDLKKCGIGWWSGWAAGLLICFFTSDEKECSETRSTVLTVLLVRLVFLPYSPVVWWTRGGGELDSKELWGGGLLSSSRELFADLVRLPAPWDVPCLYGEQGSVR